MEEEKIKHIQKESKPMWITNFFVNKPCITMIVSLCIFAIATIMTIACEWFEMSDQGDRDFYVWDHEEVKHKDMYDEAKDTFLEKTASQQVPLQSDEVTAWTTKIMLECDEDCSNVLTLDGINLLLKVEDKIKKMKHFGQFCLLKQGQTKCDESHYLHSFSNLLRETYTSKDLTKLSEAELSNALNSVFYEDNWEEYSYLFHKEFEKKDQKSRLLQAEITFGAPIKIGDKIFKNQYDDYDKQEKEFSDFTEDLAKIFKEINEDKNHGISILAFSDVLMDQEFASISATDMSFAALSVVFVWIFLTVHLKSFFISSMSMLGIIMTFPMTFVIYKGILQVTFFSFLQILIIFIILGIAADDIFVFYDAWLQSEEYYDILEGDKEKRMAITFRRASQAMLATSFTTSVSFLTNAMSPLMPIKSFGIFASIIVPMNYLMVILYFPSLIIIQEKYFPVCCWNKKKYQEALEKQSSTQEILLNVKEKKPSTVALLLETKVNDFIFKFRYIIVGVTTVWMITCGVLSTQISPLTEQEKFLPESNKMMRMANYMKHDMHTSRKNGGNYIAINMYWGTSDLDTEEIDQWDSEFPGELIWDSSFNLAPQENQLYLYNLCHSVQRQSIFNKEKGKFQCFMIDFKHWLNNNAKGFPVEENQFDSNLVEFLESSIGLPHYYSQNVGYFDNKLHYVAIEVPSIGDPNAGYEANEELELKWQEYIDNQNDIAPPGMQDGKQTSDIWAWMITERELVESSINGIFISLGFALLTLIIFTFNIIISVYSVITISGIILSVIAIMVMAGFELGMSESISIVVLIGMSVDYVVHLAHHYVESTHNDKYERTKESLKEIGVSIISGGITTLGSGCMLFFATIVTFVKFAFLIVTTVLFSFYFSMVFFTAFTHIIGPQGNQGHIIKMFKKSEQKPSE